MGHDVVLLPPDLVRPYRRGSKNDRADTKALLEAYRNEEILSVPIKSVRQHTLAALHRLRSGWLSTRTARINAVRGILRELGLFITQRLLEPIGNVAPVEYEMNYYRSQEGSLEMARLS